jgi:hypothetical protein
MSKAKHTLFETVLARMSLGAVPMDGIYWFDPKALRERTEKQQAQKDGRGEDKVHEHQGN